MGNACFNFIYLLYLKIVACLISTKMDQNAIRGNNLGVKLV